MANYDAYRPEVGKITYVARIDDLITALASDMTSVENLSAANALYITDIPATGFSLNDNVTLTLGSGNDATIQFNASVLSIDSTTGGHLSVGANKQVVWSTTTASLAYGGSTKLITSNTGITITGGVTATTFTGALIGNADTATLATDATNATNAANAALLDNIDSTSFLRSDVVDIKTSGNLTFNDNIFLSIGTGGDLDIYHDGIDTYIFNTAGHLYISSTNGLSVNGMNTKIIELGDWDMPTDSFKQIAHELNKDKIRMIDVLIVDDANTSRFNFYSSNAAESTGNSLSADATNVTIFRGTGGVFDAFAFSVTPGNRGWITIHYID